MTASLPWFRLYTEAVDDEKLRLLAFEDRWHFVAILCCKAQGIFDIPDDSLVRRKLSVKLGIDLKTLDEVHRRLAEVGLVDEHMEPLNWAARQFSSDVSTDRVRKHRERMKRSETVSETDQSRAEQIQSRKEKKQERATRLPNDFQLTPERRAVAEAEQVPAERTFEKFCDYWRAASGQHARKNDWDATWRNWCRREAENGTGKRNSPARNRHADQPERLRQWAESGG